MWGLAGLLVAGAFLRFNVVLALAGLAIVIILGSGVAKAWAGRSSDYDLACRLDHASGLHDRISTALHLASRKVGEGKAQDEMVLLQRRDTLSRLSRVDPEALFALKMPVALPRVLMLVAAVAGLMAYRVNHRPPMPALLRAAQVRIQRAIEPLHLAELEKTILRRLEDKKSVRSEDPREAEAIENSELVASPDMPDTEKAQLQQKKDADMAAEGMEKPQGDPNADPQSGEPRPSDKQQGQGAPKQAGGDPKSQGRENKNNEEGSQQSKGEGSSLADKIKQALKDLLSKSDDQPKSSQDSNSQQSDKMGSQAGGKPSDQSSKTSPKDKSGAKEQNGDKDKTSGGSGSMPGPTSGAGDASKGKKTENAQAPENALKKPDALKQVVPLSTTNFKGEILVTTTTEVGQALVPMGNRSPQPRATTNGVEQGSMPLRYRTYVQRYFDHPDQRSPQSELKQPAVKDNP
jgi:hypothetical protein